MNPLLGLALIGGVLYLAYNSGALAQFGIGVPSATAPVSNPAGLQSNISFTSPPVAPVALPSPSQVTGVNPTQLALTAGVSVGSAAAATPASFAALGLTGAAAGAAVAGIGAVAAIAAALWAAHEQRVKQATDENSAMNLGVAGYDNAMRQINAAFNARQIQASDAITLVQQVFATYWAEVTPHIQPGRNGCNGGASCPPWPVSGNGCSGDIGAACCVGCYDLAGGSGPAVLGTADGGDGSTPFYFGTEGTIITLQHGGGVVAYQAVYGSKYGGKNRPGYRLVWSQISAA